MHPGDMQEWQSADGGREAVVGSRLEGGRIEGREKGKGRGAGRRVASLRGLGMAGWVLGCWAAGLLGCCTQLNRQNLEGSPSQVLGSGIHCNLDYCTVENRAQSSPTGW